MTTATAVLTVATGAVVGVFGVLVGYYRMTGLVAGYDPEAVTDDEGLASFVGAYVLLTGVLTVAVGVAIFLELVGSSTTIWVAYSFAVVLVTVRVVIGAQQYAES